MENQLSSNPKLEPWIETYTGKKLHFLTPSPDEIDIADIAHALANECRFGGHTSSYYSVAEHSILVATVVAGSGGSPLHGLLHDASEAYLRDIASPIKQYLSNYKELEKGLMDAIATKFELPLGFHEAKEVKRADVLALKAEAAALLPSKGASWLHLYPTDGEGIETTFHCFTPKVAEEMFLLAYQQLTQRIVVPTPQERKLILAR